MLRPVVDVRLAEPDDLEDLVALWLAARESAPPASRGGHHPADTVLRSRLQTLLVGQDDVQILVGSRDGRCVGFAVMREATLSSLLDSRVLLLEHLFVHPLHRRVGVAKAMLGAAGLVAERRRLDQIVCNLPSAPRETHRFFARLGFTPVMVRRVVGTAALRRRLVGEHRRRRLALIEDRALRRRWERLRPSEGVASEEAPPAGGVPAVTAPAAPAGPDS